MLSKKQKILHEVGGRPMVAHVFEAALTIADLPPVLVVAPREDGLRELFGDRAWYVEQPERLGTGHAAMMVKPLLRGKAGRVLVTYGDMPLLRAETMRQLAQMQSETGAAVILLSVLGESDSAFGRVVRDDKGGVAEIVEVAEAHRRPDAEAILAIRELNAGVYCFEAGWLWQNIDSLPLRQARTGPEYYLTDMIGLAVQQGRKVQAITVADPDECLGAGTRTEMVAVEKAFRRRANARWLAAGVSLVDPETIYIDQTVIIGQDTVIWPNTYLQGETVIGEECIVGPNTVIRDTQIGDRCRIEQAVIEKATVKDGVTVPPFSWIKTQS